MSLTQNHIEHLQDLLERGEITSDQANVEKVKMARVQLVTTRLPKSVRMALNSAVKSGELAHMKKDGHKPEAYYHPDFEFMARGERSAHERKIRMAVLEMAKAGGAG